MDTKLFITFVILNVTNVIIQTVKSLATVKCNKEIAALVNAVAYGLYTVVLVYTVCDLPLWLKVAVVSTANLIGVYVVKWGEEKARKDKLWKIEMTVPTKHIVAIDVETKDVPHNYIRINSKHTLFNFYCATQGDSLKVKEIVKKYGRKYFVSETKIL